jgi:hypothetical protein
VIERVCEPVDVEVDDWLGVTERDDVALAVTDWLGVAEGVGVVEPLLVPVAVGLGVPELLVVGLEDAAPEVLCVRQAAQEQR